MKTPYEKKMEQLGLQEFNLFEIGLLKTEHFITALSAKYATNILLDERTFLLRTIKRMINLMRSVLLIFKTTTDRVSMMILARSIIDLNAIICFLFQHVKNDEERALRLKLFYLDGVRTRLKISKDPLRKRDPNYISEEEYNATLSQIERAKQADLAAIDDLKKLVVSSHLYTQMHPDILEKAIWKFKKIDSTKAYTLTELYEIAAGDKKMARFEQEYLSHYVHGIAISDFQFSVINETNPAFSLNICCSILNHLEPIIKTWFPADYDTLEDSFKPQLVQYIVNGLTPEQLKSYLQDKDSERKSGIRKA